MKDLLMASFNAQVKWLSPRILETKKRDDFNWAASILLDERKGKERLNGHWVSTGSGLEMALTLYNEIETNLTARFETGIPLETSYYDF